MKEKRGDETSKNLLRNSEKSQVTIFIIIAMIIVAVLLILLYPRIKVYVSPVTPSGYIEDCVKKEMHVVSEIAERGGSLEPENALFYQDKKIEHLCYTSEYYKTCSIQQPLLKRHFELEIEEYLSSRVEKCVNDLAIDYESKGYRVSAKKPGIEAEFIPRNLKITVNAPITLMKENAESYDKFTILERTNMYDLLMISTSILNLEARYGDSVPETFMLYYPNLRVEKLKQEGGSKVYIVSDRTTEERFVFATRSLSWPEGYGYG